MRMLGAIFLEILGESDMGELRVSKQLCYIAQGLKTLYLSQEACKDLGVIPRDFPKVGSCDKPFLCGMVSGEERVQVGKQNSAKVDPEEADTVMQESTPCVPDEAGGCKCP